MGDVVSELDGENKETTRAFDLRRRLASETNGESEATTFTYDFVGNLTRIERPKGPAWGWTRIYDEADRLVRVVDPFDHPTRYEYDPQDNLIRRWDANNHVTHLDYDGLDRLIETRYHDGAVWTFTLDGNGNRLTVSDPKGQTVTTSYDELNREVLRSYSAPVDPVGESLQTIGYSWDPNSNLIDATETYAGGSRVTHHDWDTFDRLDAVTDAFGKVLVYGYDLNGNRTSLVDPDGATTVYTYDGLNRLDTVTLPGGAGAADYDWYHNSLLHRVAYPNGTDATYGYNDANRVTAIDNLGPGGAPLSSYSYGYDANGNRAFQHETNGGALEITTYDYDLNDRLWQVVYPDQTTTYSFDAVGNRIFEQSLDPSATTLVDRGYRYDDRDRLHEITDRLDPAQSISYAYDSNGNQIQRTQSGATLDFRYDVRDQLLEVDVDGSNAWTFGFDFRGLRVTKWGADGLLRTTYDDSSVLQQHSAIGDPVATYRYGPDRLLAVDHFSQGPAYYHFDALGSITNLTDPTGTVQNRYQYDAWGNYRNQSGTHWNPFGFTGHEYDPETGLYYAKARFYDPEVGRFLSEDPAEPDLTTPPSLHKYLYAYGNPTYYVDPDGREVSITPKGNFVVTYPDGTVRSFTAERYAHNPAAVETAILESVAGDQVSAKHDFQVGVLKWEYQQANGTAPGDDEYIYQHYDETGPVYAITGSGEIHSASGDIELDYSVEILAVTVVTGGSAASAVRAGGATLTQTSKVFVTNVADDLAGEVLGLNPSVVRSVGKLASNRAGNCVSWVSGRSTNWAGRARFDPSGLNDAQAENAILKSIRRKSGARANLTGQIIASADEAEFMLRKTTSWRAGEKAADPALASASAGLKGTIVHSSVAKRMRALNISNLEINRRLYGSSPHLSPATGLPYEFRIPDYKIGNTILDIKPAGTPLTGSQVSDFKLFGNTSDVRLIYYDQW
jgi:RHS repeat-associated protein